MPDGLSTHANIFQRLMLQWERFAPYNAGQYMTVDRPVSSEEATAAWQATSRMLGLDQIGQHGDARVDASASDIAAYVTAQMNRRFTPGDPPLRPFVVRDATGVHVGVIYRHVVADSASIRLVMRHWFGQLFVGDHSSSTAPIRSTPGDGFHWIDPERPWSIAREALAELSRLSRMKRVRRLINNDPTQPIAWQHLELPDGLIDRLLAYARAREVRVNDLFVAAAALACDEHLPHEQSDARRDLAIGTIVDVRRDGRAPGASFGLSLGFLQTAWRWQSLTGWDHALAVAAHQSRLARERHLAEASILRLRAAVWHGASLDDRALATFYRKRCPLSAGISNVNLNRDWPAAHHPSPLVSYTRVSPTGPMLPVVFTPTTIGSRLNLGFTYRCRVVDDAVAAHIRDAFVDRLITIGRRAAK